MKSTFSTLMAMNLLTPVGGYELTDSCWFQMAGRGACVSVTVVLDCLANLDTVSIEIMAV